MRNKNKFAYLSFCVGLAVLSILCQGQVIQSQLPTGMYESLLNQVHASEVSVQSLQFGQDPNDELVVSVQLGQQQQEIVLYPFSVRSLAFAVYLQDSGGALHPVPVGPSCSYRGYIRGIDNSRISARMQNGRLFADIDTGQEPEDNYSIQPADGLAANLSAHLVYRQNDVAEEPGTCGVETDSQPSWEPQLQTDSIYEMGVRVCEIACDADNEYYVARGSDPNAVIADIETIINGVSFIYEMDTQITFEITRIIIRTDDASDPYTATNSSTLLGQLRTQWQTFHGDIQKDMVHLFTGKDLDGTIIGLASLDQVCYSSQYHSLSQTTFSTALDKRIAVAAHEIGHVFGAIHCDGYETWCRIMCPSQGNCSGGYHSFGPFSIQTINGRKTRSCLSDGTISVTSLELPFADDFSSYGPGAGPYYLDPPTRWIEADKATVGYGRLDLRMSKGTDGYIQMGTVRTRPININQPALISYKAIQNNVPNNWYLKVEYLDASLTWKLLNSIRSDGVYTTVLKPYQHLVPTNGWSHFFALRFSADGDYQSTTNREWWIDDVSIVAFAPDIDEDGDVDFSDFAAIATAWNTQSIDPGWNPQADLSSPPDGTISLSDLIILAQYWMLGK